MTFQSTQRLESTHPVRLTLVEGSEGKKLRVRGEFARAGVPTENNRSYGRKLWEREFRKLSKKMENRSLYGELDHPGDAQTKLTRVSHMITDLRLEGDLIVGEAEILDTEAGRNLAAIIKAGGLVGVSSRGYGSVVTNEQGVDVVQEDYRLVTFDFVDNPADSSAYPTPVYESATTGLISLQESKLAEQAIRQDAEVRAEADAQNRLNTWLVETLQAEKSRLLQMVTESLLADPAVAGAKTALEAVKSILIPFLLPEDVQAVVAEKDKTISELTAQLRAAERDSAILKKESDDLASVAKTVGFELYLERELGKSEDASVIRDLLGDLSQYATAVSLRDKVKSITKKLAEQREKRARAQQEAIEKEQRRAAKQKARMEQLQADLDKAREENERLEVKLRIEEQTRLEPKQSATRALIESARPRTPEGVDRVSKKIRKERTEARSADGARERIRANLSRGAGPTARTEEQESPQRKLHEDYQGSGISTTQFRQLTGQ